MERTPRSVEAIIERQVKQWELQRQARSKQERTPPPVITVSREYGARGAAVARATAERLGFDCWDRELLDGIASSTDAPRSLLATLDEHRKDVIRERLAVLGAHKPLTASDYGRRLFDVLQTIASHGKAVVVGRGAESLLDPASTLRVRVVAPLEQRVRGLAERNRISETQARSTLAEIDADRRDFMRQHYGRDVSDATAYDLVVNMERISVPAATSIVVAAYRARFGTP